MLFFILLFCLKENGAAAVSFHGPRNTVILTGSNLTLTCDHGPGNYNVAWYHTPMQNKGKALPVRLVSTGSKVYKDFSEFSVSGNKPGHRLTLNYTEMKHAGLYKCTAMGRTATAQVIVLASEPCCNTSYNGSYAHLWCSISYTGDWIPVIEWMAKTIGNAGLRSTLITDCDQTSKESPLNFSLVKSIDSTVTGYVLRLHFRNLSCARINTTADNTPDYEYEYNWTKTTTNAIFNANSIVVSKSSNFSEVLSSTRTEGSQRESFTFPVSVSAAAFALAIVVVFIILFVRKRKRQEQSSFREPNEIVNTFKAIPSTFDNEAIYAVFQEEEVLTNVPLNTTVIEEIYGSCKEMDVYENDHHSVPFDKTLATKISQLPVFSETATNCSASESSSESSPSLKGGRYQGLVERVPATPSVYLRLLQLQKEQDTQTSNSPSSSVEAIQESPMYENFKSIRQPCT